MGLCLSVALWKEKVYADGRAARRGDVVTDEVAGAMGAGDCEYGFLGGEVLEVEAAVAPTAAGVKCGAERAAAGTPARPIWQRRVLMGVKCQMPRFSGMILYDERGRPVCSGIRDRARDQVNTLAN